MTVGANSYDSSATFDETHTVHFFDFIGQKFTGKSVSNMSTTPFEHRSFQAITQGSDASTAIIDLALVQFEKGKQYATLFEHRSFGDELARCQRYYFSNLTTFHGNPVTNHTD